jgi:hypothetical protein
MLVDGYFDAKQNQPQQFAFFSEIVSVGDSFARTLFPVRPLPYILVVSVMALSLFSVNVERSEALAHSPSPFATVAASVPVVRLSLPARAAMYRENFLAH